MGFFGTGFVLSGSSDFPAVASDDDDVTAIAGDDYNFVAVAGDDVVVFVFCKSFCEFAVIVNEFTSYALWWLTQSWKKTLVLQSWITAMMT